MFDLSRRCKQLHVSTITSLGREKHKRVVLIGLILMIVISPTVASGFGNDLDEQRARDAQDESGTAVDNEQQLVVGRGARKSTTTTIGPVDARDLLVVLAVRELCLRNPTECDQSDQSDTRGSLSEDELHGQRQYNRKRRHELMASSVYATNQINGILMSLPVPVKQQRWARNLTGDPAVRGRVGDDLDRAGSWSASTDHVRFAPVGTHRIHTRAWRQPGPRAGPNTYRVSLEEARRFIRAQQAGQASYEMGTMAPALLYARPRAADSELTGQQQQQQQVAIKMYEQPQQDKFIIRPVALARGGLSEPITRSRAPVTIREQRSSEQTPVLPKRTELSPENPFATEGVTTTNTMTTSSSTASTSTSGHQLVQEESSTTSGDKTLDVMQCNLRNYTYRATKADGRGNTCTGLITASICYGGCDSGEIADWLFPYKKSIHKVCRHGGRIRRRVLLSECHSANSKTEPIEDSLREYHYVDARDCICKKCMGADTNCLGTMTQPHLQTLGETVAELTAANGD